MDEPPQRPGFDLDGALQNLSGRKSMVIYTHDNPDPDALAEEFSLRNVEFFLPLQDNEDGLRGFEIKDADGYLLYFGRPNRK